MSAHIKAKLDGVVDAVFSKYDTDGNGVLKKDEVRQLMTDLFKRSNTNVSEDDVECFIETSD